MYEQLLGLILLVAGIVLVLSRFFQTNKKAIKPDRCGVTTAGGSAGRTEGLRWLDVVGIMCSLGGLLLSLWPICRK
jgi:hypothetical protein